MGAELRLPDRVLDDGEIVVKVRSGDGEPTELKLDLLTLMVTFHPVEKKHGALVEGAVLTTAFFGDLVATIAGLTGITVTPTGAYQLWQYSWERWAELKKNMSKTQS